MLFVALITFSALSHNADWVEGSVTQSQLRVTGPGLFPVLPNTGYAAPVRVLNSAVVVQPSQEDYRMLREQVRFLTDLSRNLSRTVNRLAR